MNETQFTKEILYPPSLSNLLFFSSWSQYSNSCSCNLRSFQVFSILNIFKKMSYEKASACEELRCKQGLENVKVHLHQNFTALIKPAAPAWQQTARHRTGAGRTCWSRRTLHLHSSHQGGRFSWKPSLHLSPSTRYGITKCAEDNLCRRN